MSELPLPESDRPTTNSLWSAGVFILALVFAPAALAGALLLLRH